MAEIWRLVNLRVDYKKTSPTTNDDVEIIIIIRMNNLVNIAGDATVTTNMLRYG